MSKRVDQKQAARVVRDQLARERRRQRLIWVGAVTAAVLVLIGLISSVVIFSQKTNDYTAPPGVHSSDDSGIVIGSGPVRVDIYADYICPACKGYEEATRSTVDQLLKDNKITLVFHPVPFLDDKSTTNYSTRSSNASACASEAGKFKEYNDQLFANQPPEGGAGLTDDELIRLGGEAGLTDESFGKCVRDVKYKKWTAHVYDEANERGVTGTPTIYVNDREVERSVSALSDAVAASGK